MVFRVDISPAALNDAEAAFLWVQKRDPSSATDWFNGLLEAIYSLEQLPSRCQIASESKEIGIELRQLLYKKHRVIFGIAPGDGKVEGIVQIFRIRHHAQDRLKAEEL